MNHKNKDKMHYLILIFLIFFSYDNSKSLQKRILSPQKTKNTSDKKFSTHNVCQFKQTKNCLCLRLNEFYPEFYAQHNVRQCTPYGIWMPPMAYNKRTLKDLNHDIENKKIAFLYENNLNAVTIFSMPKKSYEEIASKRNCHFFEKSGNYSRYICIKN